MAIKKGIFQKKIAGVIYDIYMKTDASQVIYGDASTVAEELASIISTIETLQASSGITGEEADAKISAATEELYNRIMGITDAETVNEAYDTLKEVADYLANHGDVVNGITTDITALKATVGDEESGLVKQVADNAAAIAELQENGVGGGESYDDAEIKAAIAAKGAVLVGTTTPEVDDLGDNDLFILIDEDEEEEIPAE